MLLGNAFLEKAFLEPAAAGAVAVVPSFDWLQPLSVPTRALKIAHRIEQVLDPLPILNPAPALTWDWMQPFSIAPPTRSRHAAGLFTTQISPNPVVNPLLDWLLPLSEPVRLKPRAANFPQPAHAPLSPVAPVHWFNPLSTPTRPANNGRRPDQNLNEITNPAVLNVDPHWPSWIQPLAEPKRRLEIPRAVAARPDFLGLVPEVSFSWQADLQVPMRRQLRLKDAIQTSYHFTLLEPVNVYRWFAPLSEPTRSTRRAANFPEGARAPINPLVVTPFEWFTALAEPKRRRDSKEIFDRYVLAAPQIVSFGWFIEANQPTRRARTHAYLKWEEPFAYGGALSILPMDWFISLSLPVRLKPVLLAAQQPSENTPYFLANMPFRTTGPLYLNGRHVNGGQTIWRGRTKR